MKIRVENRVLERLVWRLQIMLRVVALLLGVQGFVEDLDGKIIIPE